MLTQDFGHMLGMLHTSAEHQPGLAVASQGQHLAHHLLVVVVRVHSGLQLGLNKLTASLVHTSHIQLGPGDLGAQGGQVALVDQLFDAHRLDQGIK